MSDAIDSPAPVSSVPRKLEVLAEHYERIGRDRGEIQVTKLLLGDPDTIGEPLERVAGYGIDGSP